MAQRQILGVVFQGLRQRVPGPHIDWPLSRLLQSAPTSLEFLSAHARSSFLSRNELLGPLDAPGAPPSIIDELNARDTLAEWETCPLGSGSSPRFQRFDAR